MKGPLLTLPPRQFRPLIFIYLHCLLDRNWHQWGCGKLQHTSLRIFPILMQYVFSCVLTGGTSLSTTVLKISIHSVRFCLLMSSRGRLYCGDKNRKRNDILICTDILICSYQKNVDHNLKSTACKLENMVETRDEKQGSHKTQKGCWVQWPHLEKGIKNFEDLFLYQDRVTGVVREKLDETLFQHGHKDVHRSHQRLTLFRFLISVSHRSAISHTSTMAAFCHVVWQNVHYTPKTLTYS